MSIGQWFKNLFSGGTKTDESLGDHKIDINEARIGAGGSGPGFGVATHESPGERSAEEEGFSSH